MKAELLAAASAVVPNQHILVNLVSRRVRQLSLGHRPLIEFVPGMGHADVALSEIASEKLTWESTFVPKNLEAADETAIVQFPGEIATTKKAKKKAA